jgi:multidrug efflux system outer membrane protein
MTNPTTCAIPVRRLALLCLSVLGACSSVPRYEAPALAPDRLHQLPSMVATDALAAGTPPALWWTQFGDPQLERMVELAWNNNDDLRDAMARLDSARAQLQSVQGAGAPGVTLDGGAGRSRLAAVESRGGVASIVNPRQLAAALNWELDLFGRVRHSIEAAQALVGERSALLDEVRRLILAQVVDAFLDLRGAQMLGATLQQQLDNQAGTLRLVRERESAGSMAPAERMRFEAQLRLVGARLPTLLAQERAARNRLATLTGQALDAAPLALLDRPVGLQLPQTVLSDEPVKLLARRPDVKAAERALAVAAAREGIAHAELFPRISVSALFGHAGLAGDWLSGDAGRWRAGAGFSLPLFDGGTRRAQLRAAGADVRAAQARFDRVVAVALEQTDTAMSNWVQLRRRSAELDIARGLGRDSARLARIRYQEGAESLLGVLEAERIALAAEEQLVMAQRELAAAATHCYVALAGGFDVSATGAVAKR